MLPFDFTMNLNHSLFTLRKFINILYLIIKVEMMKMSRADIIKLMIRGTPSDP